MKISELIKQLEEVKAFVGDMDLSSWDVDDNLEKRKSKSCF